MMLKLTDIKLIRRKIRWEIRIRVRSLELHRLEELALLDAGVAARDLADLDGAIGEAVREHELTPLVLRVDPVQLAEVAEIL